MVAVAGRRRNRIRGTSRALRSGLPPGAVGSGETLAGTASRKYNSGMERPARNVDILERMARAVEKVRKRLEKATRALEDGGCAYAVVGGNAIAAWVATVDESAVRNTQDVDVLVDRREFDAVRSALEGAGFVHRHVSGLDMFLDGPNVGSRDAVHVVFAGEKVRPDYLLPAPTLAETVRLGGGMRVLALDALVRMKLTSFRRKDQVHLLDLMGIGLIGEKDLANLPPIIAARLQELLEHPDG
jgi:hypothetical protein